MTNFLRARCPAEGVIVVGGIEVGVLRCDEPLGHELPRIETRDNIRRSIPPTPHVARLEWRGDERLLDTWPEAFDPVESFDIEVELDENAPPHICRPCAEGNHWRCSEPGVCECTEPVEASESDEDTQPMPSIPDELCGAVQLTRPNPTSNDGCVRLKGHTEPHSWQ